MKKESKAWEYFKLKEKDGAQVTACKVIDCREELAHYEL